MKRIKDMLPFEPKQFEQRAKDIRRIDLIHNVLEYGSGYSTLLFLDKGLDVLSFNENKKCAKMVQRASKKYFSAKSKIIYAPRVIKGNASFYDYDYEGIGEFDLIYINGPNAKIPYSSINIDAILYMLFNDFEPKYIMIDGRVKTVEYLSRILVNYRRKSLIKHTLFEHRKEKE